LRTGKWGELEAAKIYFVVGNSLLHCSGLFKFGTAMEMEDMRKFQVHSPSAVLLFLRGIRFSCAKPFFFDSLMIVRVKRKVSIKFLSKLERNLPCQRGYKNLEVAFRITRALNIK